MKCKRNLFTKNCFVVKSFDFNENEIIMTKKWLKVTKYSDLEINQVRRQWNGIERLKAVG